MILDLSATLLLYLRRLIARPRSISRLAVFILAMGIGLNSALFGVYHQMVLQPLPGVPNASNLVGIEFRTPSGRTAISYAVFQELTHRVAPLLAMAGSTYQSVNFHASGSSPPRKLLCECVTEHYFSLLGVGMAQGRAFAAEDMLGKGGEHVAVVSHRLWSSMLDGESSPLGGIVFVNRHPVKVVGMAPPGFHGSQIDDDTDIWMPISQDTVASPYMPADALDDPATNHFYRLFARLSPGIPIAHASSQMNGILSLLVRDMAGPDQRGQEVKGLIYPDAARDPKLREILNRTFRLLYTVLGAVLLISALNASGLFLEQQLARRKEWAIMRALGRNERRLRLSVTCETVIAAVVAGVLGLLATNVLLALLHGWIKIESVRLTGPFILNWRVFGFALVLSAAAGIICSLFSLFVSTSAELSSALRHPSSDTSKFLNLQNMLVAGQLAVSLVLAVFALLLVHSLHNLNRIDLGWSPKAVLSATLDPSMHNYTQVELRRLYRDLMSRLTENLGLQSFALAEVSPYSGSTRLAVLPGTKASAPMRVSRNVVTSGYFRTMGIRIMQGRDFTNAECLGQSREGGPNVLIITASAAGTLWPAEPAVGQRLAWQGGDFEVIGVAADHRPASLYRTDPQVYEPLGQGILPGRLSILLRANRHSEEVTALLQRQVNRLDAHLPLFNVEFIDTRIDRTLSASRLFARIVSIFWLVSVTLALVGLYGALSYRVAARSRELAIRMAVGATPSQIQGLLFRHAFALTAVGIGAGLALTFLLSGWISSYLYEVSSRSFFNACAVVAALAFFAPAAAYYPSRIAARLPVSTLLKLK